MDTYFFDSSAKAITKWAFLLLTYLGSILFKQFSLSVILPTVFIYFLSNLFDYIDLAFFKKSKAKSIRIISFFIVILLTFETVMIFSIQIGNNDTVNTFLNEHYFIIYIASALIWLVPLIDGIRSFFDVNIKNSAEAAKILSSSTAYDNMTQSILNKNN